MSPSARLPALLPLLTAALALTLATVCTIGCASTPPANAHPSGGKPEQAQFAPELGIALEGMERRPSGVYVQDVRVGEGPVARDLGRLAVFYRVWLPEGTRVDVRQPPNEPFRFQLGMRESIPGWETGLPGMKLGGVRRLVVPAALAYGTRGSPPNIPPNAVLVFEVELVSVE
jgi:peptidylprolyl isomerase